MQETAFACLFCPFPSGNLSFEKTWLPRRDFYTHEKQLLFSVSIAASGHEGVGGDVSEVLLGPSEHKQLVVQTTHSQSCSDVSRAPEALEVTGASPPHPAEF